LFDSWEYPGKQSIGSNIVNSQDTKNFLLFLEQLRKDPQGSRLLLTAAVGSTPFVGPDGKPLTDVSRFSQVFDFVSIMNYDVWGSCMPAVGPNAPLNDTCAASQNQAGSAVSATQFTRKRPLRKDRLRNLLRTPLLTHLSYHLETLGLMQVESTFVKIWWGLEEPLISGAWPSSVI